MAYRPTSLRAIYSRIAAYVDRVLKGANPADLPVEQPAKLELVITQDREGNRPIDPATTPAARRPLDRVTCAAIRGASDAARLRRRPRFGPSIGQLDSSSVHSFKFGRPLCE